MKRTPLLLAFLACIAIATAQTPVNMATQPSYTYTENFADLANWTFSTAPANGSFTAGIGSAPWKGNDIVATGTVGDGMRITAATTIFQTGTSSGVYQQNQALTLLSTGTTDNTTAVAMDVYLNFTGLNAGTLSFDWASLNNNTGNRKASLKVFYSINGSTFTEIPGAAVLNVTNNSPTSGHINFAGLPAALNGASNAIIRFYYYNGTGGTTGSRPKITVDNLSITAVPASACATPTAQPTSLVLTPAFSSISGSFTASSPAADGYLVIASLNNNLSAFPVDGSSYSIGDNVGDGTVVSTGTGTNFTATSLSSSTQYYFFVFAMNHLCSGGTKYLTASALTGNTSTLNGSSPCTAPAAQPTNLVFSNITASSIKGTYTASVSANADHYLVVRSTSSTLSATPVNGTSYSAGASLGGGTVVTKTQLNTFTANNLTSGITYYFFVFAVNEDNCTSGPVYNTVSPLTGSVATTGVVTCTAPSSQPIALQLSADRNTISGYFTASSNTNGYVVVYSTSNTLGATPQNGVSYTTGSAIGSGTVLANSTATSFIATALTGATTYYFYIFAKNDQCSGGPVYNSVSPLQGNATTTASTVNNYYFGNLHAHSSYSDGNKDNGLLTPADDYTYAKTAQCMDYLGISEHNHAQAGMSRVSYAPGIAQADAATSSSFLALYGMEWGVISNGGHVLVYGINQLIGWEAGNYDVFVAKSDYTGKPSTTGTTGLFKTINDWPSTAFAMLAHPDNSDYNNIANAALNPTADSAIAGCALESGPAFSTATTYNDLPSRLAYYSYYKKLLSRGYHTGPSIDHDTHYTNFGKSNYSRTAVIANTLTESSILQSLRSRKFYMTHDCNTKAYFTLNNQQMGSITTGTTAPAISVYVTDPDNAAATATIRIMYGIAGSGLLPVAIDSAVGVNVFNYTDYNLADNAQAYYYAEISMSGGYVITSPAWYTKTSVLPVTMLAFNAALNNAGQVVLSWSTTNEVNNHHFSIEHSRDGVAFYHIDSLAGKNGTGINHYTTTDHNPFTGLNYYRLRQVDVDGRYTYSNVEVVKLDDVSNRTILLPNPAKDYTIATISVAENQRATILITDATGRTVQSFSKQLQKGNNDVRIDLGGLSNGTYYLVVRTGGNVTVNRLMRM
jgi:trimeric autotransporter adhesin